MAWPENALSEVARIRGEMDKVIKKSESEGDFQDPYSKFGQLTYEIWRPISWKPPPRSPLRACVASVPRAA